MSEETPKAASSSMWIWAGAIVAACIVYGAGITHEGLWYDEAYSAAMVEHPALEIICLTPNDVHPPLYYLLLRGVRVTLGNSEWALRLLSVLGAVALVGLGAGPIRRMCGDKTAGIYVIVTLFTPAVLIYAHEARMYTLVAFAVNAAMVYGYLAVRDHKTSDWVCLGVFSAVAAYLHYYGAIAIFYLHLFAGIWLLRKGARALKPLLIATGCLFLAYLPWTVFLLGQVMDVKKDFWIAPLDFITALGAFGVPFSHKDFFPGVSWSAILAMGICYSLIVFGGVFARLKREAQEWSVLVLTAILFNATLLTAVLISVVFAPVFLPRYMLACLGPLLIALSIGIGLLPSRSLRVAAIVVWAFLNVFVIRDVFKERFNGPAREMANDFRGHITPGDLIVSTEWSAIGPSLYYMGEARHLYYRTDVQGKWRQSFRIFDPRVIYYDRLHEELAPRNEFWYIERGNGQSCQLGDILGDEGREWEPSGEPKRYPLPYSRFTFTVTKYTRVSKAATPSPQDRSGQ